TWRNAFSARSFCLRKLNTMSSRYAFPSAIARTSRRLLATRIIPLLLQVQDTRRDSERRSPGLVAPLQCGLVEAAAIPTYPVGEHEPAPLPRTLPDQHPRLAHRTGARPRPPCHARRRARCRAGPRRPAGLRLGLAARRLADRAG